MIGRTKDKFSFFSIFLGSTAVYTLHSLLMLHIDSVNQTVFFFSFLFCVHRLFYLVQNSAWTCTGESNNPLITDGSKLLTTID